jgi:hypothetical protein
MTTKQRKMQSDANAKREARAAVHAAMMARHAERRTAISLWEAAWDLWTAADCIGPEPIHPDNVGQRRQDREFTALDTARQQRELVLAANELGIDLAV